MEPLTRTAIVIGAFVMSCLAAAIAFVLCFQAPGWLAALQRPDVDTRGAVDLLHAFASVTVMVWPVVIFIALLPAVLAIAYAESASTRSIWYFLAVWIVIALLPTAPTMVAEAVGKANASCRPS